MDKRLTLLLKYIRNDRINEYRNILHVANEAGYQMISLEKWADGVFNEKKPVLVLRHDVDIISGGTRKMFEVEKEYGAYASYYFRNSARETTAEYYLINDIQSYGSEASLHFETIANYGELNKIKDRKELLNTNWKLECLELLHKELSVFRKKYKVACRTIASHGEKLNTVYGVSNNALTDDRRVYGQLGIILEAYDTALIDRIGIYISDMPIEINSGYRYGKSVVQAIGEGISPICFLSHPNHWHYSYWGQFKKIVKMIIKGPLVIDDQFVRIAK